MHKKIKHSSRVHCILRKHPRHYEKYSRIISLRQGIETIKAQKRKASIAAIEPKIQLEHSFVALMTRNSANRVFF